MQQQIYNKGNTLAWIGLLGEIVFHGLQVLATPDYLSNLVPYIPLLALLQIASIVVLVWGGYLVLKSKNRSWAWLLLIAPLSLIGLVILYYIKDKSVEAVPTTVVPKP